MCWLETDVSIDRDIYVSFVVVLIRDRRDI